MSNIGAMVDELIGGGCDPKVAARVAVELFAAGVLSTGSPRTSADSAAEKRRAYDRERRRRERECPPDIHRTSAESADSTLSLKEFKFKKEKKERERGTRCPPDWRPSAEDQSYAAEQGMPSDIAAREAAKFRDYWSAKTGPSATKLDWPATWRNWVRRVCEERGFAPTAPPEKRGYQPTPEQLKALEDRRRAEREQASRVAAEGPRLLEKGPGFRESEGGERMVLDRAGNDGMGGLATVFRPPRLRAMGGSASGN